MEVVKPQVPIPLPEDLMAQAEAAQRPHIVTREVNAIVDMMQEQAGKGRTGCAYQFGFNVATTEIISVKKQLDKSGYYTEITPSRSTNEGPYLSISWAARSNPNASANDSG